MGGVILMSIFTLLIAVVFPFLGIVFVSWGAVEGSWSLFFLGVGWLVFAVIGRFIHFGPKGEMKHLEEKEW